MFCISFLMIFFVWMRNIAEIFYDNTITVRFCEHKRLFMKYVLFRQPLPLPSKMLASA